MYSTEQTLRLSDAYCGARKIARSTLGRKAVGSSTVFERIEHDLATVRVIKRLIGYISDRWPADTPWPSDIPRPAPSSTDPKEAA